jgi:hypothetical protein
LAQITPETARFSGFAGFISIGKSLWIYLNIYFLKIKPLTTVEIVDNCQVTNKHNETTSMKDVYTPVDRSVDN